MSFITQTSLPGATNPGVTKNIFNEITGVVSGSTTTVATYTVPVSTKSILEKIEFSGENIALFTVLLNGNVIDKKRTFFGGDLDQVFDYFSLGTGQTLVSGDIIIINVLHNRPSVSSFNARIQVTEK